MSEIFYTLSDQMHLIAIKMATERISIKLKSMIQESLLGMGIEAEVEIDVKALSVNLETFKKTGLLKK